MEIAVDGGVIGLAGRQVDGEGMGGRAAPEDIRLLDVPAQVRLEQLDLQAAGADHHPPAGPE